ncbi:group I truncated hemoglobin [Teredinibacter turnerae]|uniref:group I truncated hemoglobin n=1 Tax=Teredinibacter turnerae TaxID=2426 RepID=UPI00036E00EE|nr:group 1 truncated hemoglobin [Teredinibacter turnerae]
MYRLLIPVVFFIGIVACSHTPERDNSNTLYADLGGQQGLENLVDSFIHNIGQDPAILPFFHDSKVSRFRDLFIVHLCSLANGPCSYSGDSMEDIHTGMHIDEAHFNRVVELLVDAMNENHISVATQNRLLARLAPMRASIIHR